MAKFNIEVELDWLGGEEESENLDQTLRDEITRKIVEQAAVSATKNMESEIKKVMEEKMDEFKSKIDKKLESLMDDFFDTPRDITDRWGSVVRTGVTARKLLAEAADKFFTEKVDEKGEVGGYGAKYTRIEHIVKKAVSNDVTWAVERAVKDAVEQVKKTVKNTATKQLGEKLAEVVGLENII